MHGSRKIFKPPPPGRPFMTVQRVTNTFLSSEVECCCKSIGKVFECSIEIIFSHLGTRQEKKGSSSCSLLDIFTKFTFNTKKKTILINDF